MREGGLPPPELRNFPMAYEDIGGGGSSQFWVASTLEKERRVTPPLEFVCTLFAVANPLKELSHGL